MHEYGGVFCNSANSLENRKFTEQEKKRHGPKLELQELGSSPWALARSEEKLGCSWGGPRGPTGSGGALGLGQQAKGRQPRLHAVEGAVSGASGLDSP